MNKKATMIHWIILGVLIALGVFFLASKWSNVGIEVKGQWQLDFLEQNYLEAKKEQLKTEIVAREIVSEIALKLASQSGFIEDSPCGKVSGSGPVLDYNLWNKAEENCFPDIIKNVAELADQKFKEKLPQKEYSDFKFKNNFFLATGKNQATVSKVGTYGYNSDLALNLGYSFEEYDLLKSQAQILINSCKNQKELLSCLDQQKQVYWHYSSCEKEQKPSSAERIISFCVESPNLGTVQAGNNSKKIIQYHIVLDFTPGQALAVTGIKVAKSNGKHQITFEQDTLAEGYRLHYTNWPEVASKSGLSADVFSNMPSAEGFGYFHQSVELSNPQTDNCPSEKQSNTIYLCGKELIYLLEDNTLDKDKEYWFGLASVKERKESEIAAFIQN
ncbi:MAG TPA: hypothetical protein VJA23_00810 [Candidatus Nanoarchaeia archaeon]|nr:hypothetical protein [Candidatus Nanoarchaeia archaeon]